MALDSLTGIDFTILLWGGSVTPLFMAVDNFRQKDVVWGSCYAGAFVALVSLGFFWPKLPLLASGIGKIGADKIFLIGVVCSAAAYAFARRTWVSRGDRQLISGFGEGIAVFAFVTLLVSPFVDSDLIGDIFDRQKEIFAAGGLVGLILVFVETYRSEKEAEFLEKLSGSLRKIDEGGSSK
jgi:hypothetical protein